MEFGLAAPDPGEAKCCCGPHAVKISDEMWLWPTRRARFAGDSTRQNRGCLGCLECVEECLECLERVLGGGGLNVLSVLIVMGASSWMR